MATLERNDFKNLLSLYQKPYILSEKEIKRYNKAFDRFSNANSNIEAYENKQAMEHFMKLSSDRKEALKNNLIKLEINPDAIDSADKAFYKYKEIKSKDAIDPKRLPNVLDSSTENVAAYPSVLDKDKFNSK